MALVTNLKSFHFFWTQTDSFFLLNKGKNRSLLLQTSPFLKHKKIGHVIDIFTSEDMKNKASHCAILVYYSLPYNKMEQ